MASFNLPFTAQSSAVIWKKEHPSQRAYTTFADRRYRQQYRNPPPIPPFRPPLGAYITSICQPKALFDLPFATQSLAVIWEKEHPS